MSLLDLDCPRTPIARLLTLVERRVPTPVSRVVAQVRRDVAVVEGRLLRGDKPAPLLVRRAIHVDPKTVAPVSARTEAPVVAASSASAALPLQAKAAPAFTEVVLEDAGRLHTIRVAPGRYVLESALEQNVNIPFSCTLGGCGSCRVTLVEGAIEIDEPHGLSEEEIAAGIRLTCVGRVTSSSCRIRLDRDAP